jgi:Pyruvate/2-oxoacid:ferredoxin oxidoreductase delta subunit
MKLKTGAANHYGFYQQKQYQARIFMGFDPTMISPMCAVIDHFVDYLDLSFFNPHVKSDRIIGGRPAISAKCLLKIYMYTLLCGISLRNLDRYYSIGSELAFLTNDDPRFPKRTVFSKFLPILAMHIDHIFDSSLRYIRTCGVEMDVSNLYGDGTVMEAWNSRHRIITQTNVDRSNKKWNNILQNPDSTAAEKVLAEEKLAVNIERTLKLKDLGRKSYGRNDEDCVLAKDKNSSYIAGYNAQFIEESNHGLVVYCHLSNQFPDCEAFKPIIDTVIELFHPKTITLDTGYESPEILLKLIENDCTPLVRTRKMENAKTSINEFSFELSADDCSLICPTGRTLVEVKSKDSGETRFKSVNCDGCLIKERCCPKGKSKSVTINVEQFKTLKNLFELVDSDAGIEIYSHRGNMCESPHGHIKSNLKGKKFGTTGLDKCNAILKIYAILFNLRRMLSILGSD